MSNIEWTGLTWNPTIGCRRVSAGCENCYAEILAHRFQRQFAHYAGTTDMSPTGPRWTGVYNVAPDHILYKPNKNRTPTTYFVNSMSDLFGEGVTDETIKLVFDIMNSCPHHTFQILTKRPNRAARMASELLWSDNIWIGTSVELDKFAATRARDLRKIPAKTRFISAEPLLGPLPSLDLTGINWIIVGGESGRSRAKIRPMKAEWAREIRDKAIAARAGFFFKQWGNWSATGQWNQSKSAAGRELDGVIWDEQPRYPDDDSVALAPAIETKTEADNTPTVWNSAAGFRNDLAIENALEDAPPVHLDQSPRVSLREPIWKMLRARGEMSAQDLRMAVLTAEGLDAASARLVNYHAWSLVDLQNLGWVERVEREMVGKRGRTKTVVMYRATKPRVRVRAA